MKLGFMSSEEVEVDGIRVVPRRVLERLLELNLPPSDKDVTLLRVTVEGWKGTEARKVEFEMIDYFDDASGLTSMMRTTSFPAAIVAVMLADGTISERGVLPPERAIPPDLLLRELDSRGVHIEKRVY